MTETANALRRLITVFLSSITRAFALSMFAGPPGIVAVESVIRLDARGVCERRD